LLEAASFLLRELLETLPSHGHGVPPCSWNPITVRCRS
jgi:hypothetical protein